MPRRKNRAGSGTPIAVPQLGPDIDCDTCIHRKECERACSGSFCTKWASREPRDRGPNPAEEWARGEDADL